MTCAYESALSFMIEEYVYLLDLDDIINGIDELSIRTGDRYEADSWLEEIYTSTFKNNVSRSLA